MKFAKRIRILLVECGNLSEAELARRLGVKPPTFNRKMHTDNFSVTDLEEIASALEVQFKADFILPDGREV